MYEDSESVSEGESVGLEAEEKIPESVSVEKYSLSWGSSGRMMPSERR